MEIDSPTCRPSSSRRWAHRARWATPRRPRRLTREALETATKEALSFWHNYIGCEHLLLGLLATEDGVASKVLRRMGIELRTTRRAVTTALSGFVHVRRTPPRPAPVVEDSLRVLHRLDAIETQLADLWITDRGSPPGLAPGPIGYAGRMDTKHIAPIVRSAVDRVEPAVARVAPAGTAVEHAVEQAVDRAVERGLEPAAKRVPPRR